MDGRQAPWLEPREHRAAGTRASVRRGGRGRGEWAAVVKEWRAAERTCVDGACGSSSTSSERDTTASLNVMLLLSSAVATQSRAVRSMPARGFMAL